MCRAVFILGLAAVCVLPLGLVNARPQLKEPLADVSGDEEAAKKWLENHDRLHMKVVYASTLADWTYNTNLTDYNLKQTIIARKRLAEFENEAYEGAMAFDWQNFSAPVERHFSKIVDIGTSVLSEDKLDRVNELGAELEGLFSLAKVCGKPGDSSTTCYPMDPDLTHLFATSRDWEELVWAWQGWRNASGRQMPLMYTEFADLQNEAAKLNGYGDNGAYWRSWYESDGFRKLVADLWQELKPFYQELHSYVRRQLKKHYSSHAFPTSGHIPAHLLGNMWGQQWNNIEALVRPFPESPNVEVTDEMVKQGYDVDRIFRLAEKFFVSLGLSPMPASFWEGSMLVRPTDREVVCHASAWDFMDRKDFRIKQCTEIDMDWLFTTHHEMGHIEYFLTYKHLPTSFRDGANPGFHEAIGDILELSVSTPEHLREIGLLPTFEDTEGLDLNFLMDMALRKVAFLPFGYLIDQWRWDVFSGKTTSENYNRDWWNLRCSIQGLAPPVPRSEDDFDAGAKFHVPNNTPYIRYFISHIMQFQFHKALCEAANNTRPLHRCDIYQSREAGALLKDILELGSSMPWQDILELTLGTREIEVTPLLEYFQPLITWLKNENEAAGDDVGWEGACDHGMA